MRLVWGVLGLLCVCAFARLAPAPAQADGPTTVTFTEVGAHTFTVPANVTSIHVVAVGAPGGDGEERPGGLGAVATADVAVNPGQSLSVFVGGAGVSGDGQAGKATSGGFNGGGDGAESFSGGGGGASDVRASAADLTSRLVVAGGGGGGGWSRSGSPGGNGGASGEDGGSINGCTGGTAGTDVKGGAGGKGSTASRNGGAGSLGQGGDSGSGGAGGGGGLFGGGAGGRYVESIDEQLNYCAGAGGSSGFGPGTSNTSVSISQSRTPSVTITYTPGATTAPPPPGTGGNGGSQTTKATLSLPAVQHGKAVVGTVTIPANRSSLKAKLFLKGRGGNHRLLAAKKRVVGSLTEAPLKKGLHSFTVHLNRKGKKSLSKLGKLKLTLEVKVTPPAGVAATATKKVTLKP